MQVHLCARWWYGDGRGIVADESVREPDKIGEGCEPRVPPHVPNGRNRDVTTDVPGAFSGCLKSGRHYETILQKAELVYPMLERDSQTGSCFKVRDASFSFL